MFPTYINIKNTIQLLPQSSYRWAIKKCLMSSFLQGRKSHIAPDPDLHLY